MPLRHTIFMGIADGRVEADGDVIYTGKELRVGLFQMGQAVSEIGI